MTHSEFEENLRNAYKIMAHLVKKHGTDFLPVFKRLHEEMEMIKQKNDLQRIALNIAEE